MAPVRNARHLFNEIPNGHSVVGKTTVHDVTQTIDPDTVPLNGGFLLKTLILSIEPLVQGMMRDPSVKAALPLLGIGQPVMSFGIGKVIRSENDAVKEGDLLHGFCDSVEYQVKTDPAQFQVLRNDAKIPLSVYLGLAGLPGQTAYYGWKEYSRAKEGEVVFVSGGAGPVGSMVIQLAKKQGLKVIASAGSDAKVEFLKGLGADIAFNYKKSNTGDVLSKEGPIDVYWDNVGGETLEAALDNANLNARFIECGMVSHFNVTKSERATMPGIRNMFQVITKAINIQGLLVYTLAGKYQEEFYKTVPAMIASGDLKYSEHVYHGLEFIGQAIYDNSTGANTGKSLVLVTDD